SSPAANESGARPATARPQGETMTQTAYDVEPQRQIKHVTIPAGEGRAAVYSRVFDAAIADVWDACTDPRRLGRWFLPLKGDLREGGSYELVGIVTGQILRCDAPHLVLVSWEYQDFPVDQVELRLTALDPEHTLLELEHATVKHMEE